MSSPLGYVFWHKPHKGTSPGAHEEKLLAFQRSLKAHPPDGLVDALSFREGGLPWGKLRSTTYEDWHLVNDYQSLGALNEDTVDDVNQRSREVAEEVSVAAGGLYARRLGDLRLQDALHAAWVRKPARTTYEEFLSGLSKMAEGRSIDLWQRHMVLGPASEFCVHGEGPHGIPRELRRAAMRLGLVAEREP